MDTPADPLSSESPLFSQAQTYFRKGVHISVKMHRIDMTLCQRDVKQFSASIGHKQLVSKLNTRVHFDDYRKVNSMYRKLSLRTCDARWRSQPRPPSQHKPVSAQLLWLPGGGIPGSVRILGKGTQFWQNILNLYYSTGSWKLFSCPLLAFCVRGRQCE